jgi:AcrR family transcriptional regulator
LPKTIRKRTRENAEDRRERILDEAIGLIGQRGYYGFTVKELAQKCGLSNAGLLYHFSSKDQLLGAVIGHLESTEAAFMAPLVARAEPQAARGGASLAALKKLLQTMVARAGAHSELGRLHAVLLAESLHRTHPAYDSFRARETAVLGLFARLVAPHVRASIDRSATPCLDGRPRRAMAARGPELRSGGRMGSRHRFIAARCGRAGQTAHVK